MLVDPEILRAFAGQVDSVSAAITGADVGKKVSSAGQAVRGAGDTFEVTDDALAGSFDGLF